MSSAVLKQRKVETEEAYEALEERVCPSEAVFVFRSGV
jgi:hypothetical protein